MNSHLAACLEQWRKRLLDIGKRNPLVNCRLSPKAALVLEHPPVADLWQALFAGDELLFPWKRDLVGEDEQASDNPELLRLSLFGDDEGGVAQAGESRIPLEACLTSPRLDSNCLLTPLTDRALGSRLSRLSLNAKTALAEQGINVLFVAFGLVKWFESDDSDVPLLSPLLLVPVVLDRIGTTAPWKVSIYEEEVTANHCLRELFRRDLRIDLPLPDVERFLEEEFFRDRYLDTVRKEIQDQQRWEVLDKAVLGQFSFQKLAMYEDYGKNAADIVQHPHCQRIAGDEHAPPAERVNIPAPTEFDAKIHPSKLHTVLPCDASQLEAILATKDGASLVLDGPPGTGKSQTIANIIAESLADGKTVLFVSEKAAALEVVKRRLDRANLGDFVLDCHSHKASKKEVIEELGRCLGLNTERYNDRAADLDRLFHCRTLLNRYVTTLHQVRAGLETSAFDVHGRLSAVAPGPISRCRITNVREWTSTALASAADRLRALGDFREVIANYDNHAWRGCRVSHFSLSLEDEAQQRLAALAQALRQLSEPIQEVIRCGQLKADASLNDVTDCIASLHSLLAQPPLPATWFCDRSRQIVTLVNLVATESETYRKKVAAVKEFTESAVDEIDVFEAAASALDDQHGWLRYVRLASIGMTLRGKADALARIAREIDELAHSAESVSVAAQDVVGALAFPVSSLTYSSIPVLLDLAGLIGRCDVLRESWFDETKAADLREFSTRSLHRDENLKATRAQLERVFNAVAFEAEGREIAKDHCNFDSLWKRLWPGWRRLKRAAIPLFLAGNPKQSSVLLKQLASLKLYHDDCSAHENECRVYTNDLVADGKTFVWQATLDGLAAAEKLRSVLRRVPPSFVRLLCTPGAIHRGELASASDRLTEAFSQFGNKLASVRERFVCSHVNGAHYNTFTPAAFSEWLRGAAHGISEEADRLKNIVSLLKEDHDVEIRAIPARVAFLKSVHASRESTRLAARQLDGLIPASDKPENVDWNELVSAAGFLARLLHQHSENIPTDVVQVVTASEIRLRVADACRRASELLANAIDDDWKFLTDLFPTSQPIAHGIVLERLPLERLIEWLNTQTKSVQLLKDWLGFSDLRQQIESFGIGEVLAETLRQDFPVNRAESAFLARFYRLWLDAVYQSDPALRGFRVEEHERLVEEFRSLDKLAIESSIGRLRTKMLSDPERPHAEMLNAPPTSELGVLLREVNKRKRHLPLRQLFHKVPSLLLRIKPCLMMSPLAVSTYLESAQIRFDVVIFDEASQVLPWDAIGAVYRGKQLIVAGDQRQLPPTTFFDRMVDDDDEDESGDDLADFESVLDVLCSVGMPRRRLRWHYRSKREPLIAFSNRYFYDNELMTFPSPHDLDGSTAVSLRHVKDGRWRSKAGFNPNEAKEVAQAILDHFRRFPDKSLGVITLNQRQQLAVWDELTRLRQEWPEYDALFNESGEEPLFIKNLENVQGDERDRIILSIVYGPDEETGKLAHRFGPLNNKGGERRLNVAVTRAKEAVTIVSSIRADDIDLNKTNSAGARLLRAYLEYAEKGPGALARAVSEGDRDFESPFEEAVAEQLIERGLDVRRQVGCGGYRIDLAVVHPDMPGRYLLGIECDGAAYHRTATARDRDRIRQDILVNLGWRIIRIWSTDWVRDPSKQIDRILQAYRDALENRQVLPAARDQDDDDPHNERPIIRIRDVSSDVGACRYSNIDDVPDGELIRVVISLTVRFGATACDDLIKSAARELGFQRTGNRIQSRVGAIIERLLQQGRLRKEDPDRVTAS